MGGTLEVDLTCCLTMKTVDRTLNLKTSETQANVKPAVIVWVQEAR